jgi:hypothetical protein
MQTRTQAGWTCRRRLAALLIGGILAGVSTTGYAEEAAAEPAEGPPLPFHAIEGASGHFSVMCSYLANAPKEGEIIGLPSVGLTFVHLGHGKHLEAYTITENIMGRIELGYGLNYLDVGDVYDDMSEMIPVFRPSGHSVKLHNFNARFMLLEEGQFDLEWLPAVTAGIHYKYNSSLDDLDDDVSAVVPGGLKTIAGINDDKGIDATLFMTKMLTVLPRPLIVTAGVRASESAHIGLLGFTGHYKPLAEVAVCYLATDWLALAAEYRQKPSTYDEVPGLLKREDDWWVLAAGFLPTPDLSVALGYGHFGNLLNHAANQSWGLAVKYEF